MSEPYGPQPEPKGAWSSGLTAAIAARDKAKRRAPTEADVPPPSTFPLTPAARAALELSGGVRGRRTFATRRRPEG